MDEAEAGRRMKWYSKCNRTWHTYKKYTIGVSSVNPAEAGMAQLELFDSQLDVRHRSCRIAVQAKELPKLRSRVSDELMRVDTHWILRLCAARLLPLCQMLEVDVLVGGSEVPTRFRYGKVVLAALVDMWRPETNTSHLPCGEMAPTLEDISLLMGQPCTGAAVRARDMGMAWHDELLGCFSVVQRRENLAPFRAFTGTDKHDLTKAFLVQFMVRMSYDEDMPHHLEVYLLRFFSWVMFTETYGNTASRSMISYASVVDADLGEVPKIDDLGT
ncbi:uncharacterized protein LOC133910744 [Phragmites australis]|uniref:uncharacterized protein LOC133910744 n=1 Tax=Phragmites australis TaxID=29695 RepID=UPI002D796910|nr:uncharacterized protein LOC133910744 [Phragmites australis]